MRLIDPRDVDRIRLVLQRLDLALQVADLNLHSCRLHRLAGGRAGFRSITARANRCIVCRFENGRAYEIELIDYHQEQVMAAASDPTFRPMHDSPHPDPSVKIDFLEPAGRTVTEGAKAFGVGCQALSRRVNGQAGIAPEIALGLAKAVGGTPDTWLRPQMA